MNYNYLLNFSASYQGGGLKRLLAFSKWFHENGGATFIIHQNCSEAVRVFRNNYYHILKPNKIKRLISDGHYLHDITKGSDPFDLYFSYGIPMYFRIAKVNWFHLSNLLPLGHQGITLGFKLKLMMSLLEYRLNKSKKNCDIISAESAYSLDQYRKIPSVNNETRYLVSNNGVDAELIESAQLVSEILPQITLVGTQPYKAILRSYEIFKHLQQKFPELILNIIGEKSTLARKIASDTSVRLLGHLPQSEVYKVLKKSTWFISTSLIENSSNAALEGILLSANALLSDIPPNKELLEGCEYSETQEYGEKMLLIKRSAAVPNLKFKMWNQITEEIILEVNEFLRLKKNREAGCV